MSRIRFILDPWIRFRWLRIRILGNFNSVNLGFPYEMFCNVFFHINYIYYKIQNVTKKTFRRICRKDQPITRTNFFHGFGKFLALPGSGSVSSETDPAKWYGSIRIRIRNTDNMETIISIIDRFLNSVTPAALVCIYRSWSLFLTNNWDHDQGWASNSQRVGDFAHNACLKKH